MSKGESGLFNGTNGCKASSESAVSAGDSNVKTFQGNRTREEYSALARDPARGNKVDNKGKKERDIALDLERQRKLGHVIRDPQAEKGADFIDTTTGQKWDIKSPVSHPKGHTSPKKGAFSIDRMMANVMKELSRGNKVILDTRRLTKDDRQLFKEAISKAGLDDSIIWYDKRGD